jgi:hypothetical protein
MRVFFFKPLTFQCTREPFARARGSGGGTVSPLKRHATRPQFPPAKKPPWSNIELAEEAAEEAPLPVAVFALLFAEWASLAESGLIGTSSWGLPRALAPSWIVIASECEAECLPSPNDSVLGASFTRPSLRSWVVALFSATWRTVHWSLLRRRRSAPFERSRRQTSSWR